MNKTEIRAKLEAIIAGCEGVTPGPWVWHDDKMFGRGGALGDEDDLPYGDNPPIIQTDSHVYGPHGLDADHIARLDPDTVRVIAELALAVLRKP